MRPTRNNYQQSTQKVKSNFALCVQKLFIAELHGYKINNNVVIKIIISALCYCESLFAVCRSIAGSPTALQIISAMNRICNDNAVKPKYLISDKGTQFTSSEFRSWCNENEIKQRFGAVGKHGSIAVTERVILTYKDGCTRRILVLLSKNEMVNETRLFFDWYNEYRPHMTLSGKTPNEVYYHRHPANAKPRIETRPLAKHKTPCASPRMCIAGRTGAKINVRLDFLEGRLHLPIIKVERI